MPPALKSIRLRNVRCFRDALIPLNAGINVIIGGNGSGKTTLLEALASLAPGYGEGLQAMPLRRNAKFGQVTLIRAPKHQIVAKWSARVHEDGSVRDETRRRMPAEMYTFVYGRYRRVYTQPEGGESRPSDPLMVLDQLASRATKDCTNTLNVPENNLVRDISGYVAALNAGRSFDPRLELVWRRLSESLPTLDPALEGLEMEPRGAQLVPVIKRRGLSLELRELSDGYQALLVIIFDLMLRYPYIFPELANPLDGTAIVGVDEVELHLHPKWQRTVVLQLAQLFPNTKFILTTHSPLVVQGAIDSKCAIVRMVEKGNEVLPEPLPPRLRTELEGAEVGSVLFEDHLFGLPSRYSTTYDAVERDLDELQEVIESGEASQADYKRARAKAATLEKLVAKEDLRRADGSTVAHMTRLQKALIDDLVDKLSSTKQ